MFSDTYSSPPHPASSPTEIGSHLAKETQYTSHHCFYCFLLPVVIKFYCDVIVSSTLSKSSEIGYYRKISSVNHKSPDATRFSPHTLLFRLLPAASANNAFVQVDLLSTSRKSGSHQNGFRRRRSWFRGRMLYNGRLDFKIQELWVVIWVLPIWKAWIPPETAVVKKLCAGISCWQPFHQR